MNEDGTTREMLSPVLIRYRMAFVVLSHAGLFALALFASFLLSYNFKLHNGDTSAPRYWVGSLYLPLLAIALPLKLLVYHWTRQYHGSWRYVGLRDLFGVTSASLVATFLFLTVYFAIENVAKAWFGEVLIDRTETPNLRQSSVFFLDFAVTVAVVSGARILARFYYEDIQPRQTGRQTRVLIVGAGDAGEAALREMLRLQRERYVCVGILDDRPALRHARIHGVEVLGPTSETRRICEQFGVQEVWFAMQNSGPKALRMLVEQCEGTGVQFRTIPAVSDLVEGRVQVRQIRDVDIADLLGRDSVKLDVDRIAQQLRGRRVVVTGAGGSIGSEMCRQVASFEPEVLVLIEQAENNLFEIERELRRGFPKLKLIPYVADIVDRPRIEAIFRHERPSVVFHAAAHKHVPMMELNPGEAIKNNVGGTRVVAESAIAVGAEKMVMISTDKAVNPTSIMGCTKRVAELFVQTLHGHGTTQFVTVRFGNVLGSSGSVVPIFREQIAVGGPVTVTHPDMVRYFMTIKEAAQLVLQAGTMGKGGEIYVLHMGEPVRILDLARDMITLSGLRPGIDIEIQFSGKRPGEKLFEELSAENERIGDTSHPKIGIWKHNASDFDAIRKSAERLLQMADTATPVEIMEKLKRIVPEYSPDDEREEHAGRATSRVLAK